jgi:hypothetical protein
VAASLFSANIVVTIYVSTSPSAFNLLVSVGTTRYAIVRKIILSAPAAITSLCFSHIYIVITEISLVIADETEKTSAVPFFKHEGRVYSLPTLSPGAISSA